MILYGRCKRANCPSRDKDAPRSSLTSLDSSRVAAFARLLLARCSISAACSRALSVTLDAAEHARDLFDPLVRAEHCAATFASSCRPSAS